MPTFKYRTLDSAGKSNSGEAKAKNSDLIVKELQSRGFTVLEIIEIEDKVSAPVQAMNKVRLTLGMSKKDLMVFTRQLATTLMAGVPLLRILAVMRRRCRSRTLAALLDALSGDLQKGLRFSDALAQHKVIFNDTYINMAKVGEASGNLPEVMTRLAVMIEKEVGIQRKVRSAAAYPVFVTIFTMVLTYALLVFLMPMFTPIFEGVDIDIPKNFPLTDFLIKASKQAKDPFTLATLGGGGFVLFLIAKAILKTKAGAYTKDLFLFNLPLFNKLILESASARFARTFGLLLQSGVPLLQALNLVGNAAGNLVVTRAIEKVAREVSEGGKLSERLDQANLFPDLMVQMASIGEEAGSLPDMFDHVAAYYEEEVDATVTSLTAVLEPAMMVMVGGLVCIFVLGLLLPILSLSTKVGGGPM
ncbi:type II secretion system F family protein [bacterium]|nr:type II secretion system F family protein [bacterium]